MEVPVANGWLRVGNANAALDAIAAEAFKHPLRELSAIRSRDMGRWHLSVAHRKRVPTWDELGFARDSLLPADVWLMVAHPPRRYWLNYNRRVLHLWQFEDAKLIEQFMFEDEDTRTTRQGKLT